MKTITKDQAKEIDLKANKELGVPSLMMMENAGIRTAEFCLKLLKKSKNKRVAIFCGKGNNCGDGLVISRQLISSGILVDTYLLAPAVTLPPAAGRNYRILSRITKRIYRIETKEMLEKINLDAYALLVDAIFGIGLKGRIEGIFKETIREINHSKNPKVVSVDVPSGIDSDSGSVLGAAVRADYTVSMIAAKKGLVINQGKRFCGKLIISHIGFPFP